MKITMTSLFVDDPVKAYKFYTEILGFLPVFFTGFGGRKITS